MKTARSILVGYDPSNGKDNTILLVGEKKPGMDVEIINAYQGKEAEDIWKKLTVRKEDD